MRLPILPMSAAWATRLACQVAVRPENRDALRSFAASALTSGPDSDAPADRMAADGMLASAITVAGGIATGRPLVSASSPREAARIAIGFALANMDAVMSAKALHDGSATFAPWSAADLADAMARALEWIETVPELR